MTITVLIIISKHTKDIYKNVVKLANQNVPLTVIVNGFNAETVNFLRALNLKFFILNDKLPKSAARNFAVAQCATDIIYWLDDDAYFTAGNTALLQTLFEKYPNVSIIGGPNITPPDATNFETLQGIALATPFVSGKMEARYKSAGAERITTDTELILCNMAFKRDVFTKHNLSFEKMLHYAEENLLTAQAQSIGLKALYAPNLIVYHARRSSIYGLALQFFHSGYGRGLLPLFTKGTVKLYHLIPAAFALYILAFACFTNIFFAVPLMLYFALSAINALRASKPIIFITFIIHFFYGTGIIFAFITRIIWKILKK